ncbi:MAG: hypothetical protein WC956_03885, partial [bacterium]
GEVNVSFEKLCAISRAFDTPLSHIFLFPLSSSPGLASNVDDLVSALTPHIHAGNETTVDSLKNVVREFTRSIERSGNAVSASLTNTGKKRETTYLRAAQTRRPYRKRGSK